MNQAQLLLPKGVTLLENQVAGHIFTPDTEALGMLRDESVGCVFKPMGKPECGERELSFYERIKNTDDEVLVKVRDLVPKFYNKIKLKVNSKEHTFLKLEDLSYGMLKPCIMDIKMGKRTWDPLASLEKREIEEQKYTLTKQFLGLCLPGFQVYKNGILHKYGKEYGKELDAKGVRHTIRMFLNAEHNVHHPLISEILNQLYAIREWFKQQTVMHFYASSLLIAYDSAALELVQNGQQNGILLTNGVTKAKLDSSNHININSYPPNDEKCLDYSAYNNTHIAKTSEFVKVRMIDFAHAFPAEDGQLDKNYLFGLDNLIQIMEEING